MNTYTLYISGTHCPSCKILIEDILSEDTDIIEPRVNLEKETLTFISASPLHSLIITLHEKLSSSGYRLSETKQIAKIDTEILWTAVPIGLGLLLGFFILQKSGILSFGI